MFEKWVKKQREECNDKGRELKRKVSSKRKNHMRN